jgi:hypothetical protein
LKINLLPVFLPDNRAQDPGQLYGKILRIDVENSPTNSYQIPVDNPFVDDPDYLPEIWALGRRNPWRFSFDKLTDDIYIADVRVAPVAQSDVKIAIRPKGKLAAVVVGISSREGEQDLLAFGDDQIGIPARWLARAQHNIYSFRTYALEHLFVLK